MRAILIDPVAKTVTETDYNGDHLHIYRLLSDPEHGLNVDTFDVVRLDRHNVVYVDDKGLLNDTRYFFTWRGYHNPLAGRGLILGNDAGGENIATPLTLEQARDMVSFPSMAYEDREK